MCSPSTILSVTSISGREKLLEKCLRSLANQKMKESFQIRLYLSEEPYLLDRGFPGRRLPADLQRCIEQNGVSVFWVPNTGSYRKFVPVTMECREKSPSTVIITCDDDIEYRSDFAAPLRDLCIKHNCVACHRSYVIPYGDFRCRKSVHRRLKRSALWVTTGGGVAFQPRHVDHEDFANASLYTRICPKKDDAWLNWFFRHKQIDVFSTGKMSAFGRLENPEMSLWVQFNSKSEEESQHTLVMMDISDAVTGAAKQAWSWWHRPFQRQYGIGTKSIVLTRIGNLK